MRTQRRILRLRSPHVFLVPVTAHLKRRNFRLREMRLNRHVLPELHVARLRQKDLRRRQLRHSCRRSGACKVHVVEEEVELVILRALRHIGLLRLELLHIIETVRLAKRAVVEEVVAPPDVRHRRLRADRLHRRMRIDPGHHRKKPRIAHTQHAHLAGVIRHILQQPVDGVARVGRLIDIVLRLVLHDRPVHHERAARAIASANVLVDEDVAARRQLRLRNGHGIR